MPPVDEAVRSEERSGLIPPPVRAGIGLVAAGVETAKSAPGRLGHALGSHLTDVVTLPLRGLTFVVKARETVERTYEELTHRGETVVARLRGKPEAESTTQPTTAPAPPEVIEELTNPFHLPEQVVEAIDEATPGATLSHDELPLDDYDHMTLGSLRARLPRLDAVALVQLLDYERAHAHRLPVLTMLENRIAKLGKDA